MKKIFKETKTILILTVCTCILVVGATTIYYRHKIKNLTADTTKEIQELKEYNKYISKDVDTYKYLYNDLTKDNNELKSKYEITCNDLNNIKEQLTISKDNEKKLSRGGFANKDLRTDFAITTDELNKWIDARAPKNSPFRGNAQIFINASKETGIDPKYLISHAALESSWGTSNIAKQKNNYFGINAQNSDPDQAYYLGDSLEQGIMVGAKWIKDNYIDQGQSSLTSMLYGGPAYCQNDDGTPRQMWIDEIVNIIYK